MVGKIRVGILDDHQAIIDGYSFRLSKDPDIEIVSTGLFGDDLEPMLERHTVDVLLLDVTIPCNPENPNPYPILHLIPKLLQKHPNLSILVISMHNQRTLINAIMESGASGYILKDDQAMIRELAAAVHSVAEGGIQLSQFAYQQLSSIHSSETEEMLTPRQLEALSLCATYMDASTADLAAMMNIANSTVRNLLSGAYLKLNVRSRAAAVAKARQVGLISPETRPAIQIDNLR
jgi:DNA-binding NarL/FixJ family response regulator